VCIYVCVYIYILLYVCICMYLCMYVCVCVHVYVCVCTYIYIYMLCMYVFMHAGVRVLACMRAFTKDGEHGKLLR